jgi:hypothetical protein
MKKNPNIEALETIFQDSWEPMISLMNNARKIEFIIRITAEVLSQQTFSKAKNFDDFMNSPRKSQRKKMEKHIKEIFGTNHQKFILIRQCADSLAHADYLAARNRINQYKEKYGLKTALNNNKKGMFLYKNVKQQDGEITDIGYLLQSSDQNLILEEYEVFKYNGYIEAAYEILSYTENELNRLVPRINIKYASLVAQRGLKYGVRQKKSDNKAHQSVQESSTANFKK